MAPETAVSVVLVAPESDGARLELGRGSHLIGSGLDCDIFLGVCQEKRLAQIDVDDAVTVVPLAEGVVINGAEAAPGEKAEVASGALRLIGGGVTIEVIDGRRQHTSRATTAGTEPRASRQPGRMGWLAFGGVCAIGVIILGWNMMRTSVPTGTSFVKPQAGSVAPSSPETGIEALNKRLKGIGTELGATLSGSRIIIGGRGSPQDLALAKQMVQDLAKRHDLAVSVQARIQQDARVDLAFASMEPSPSVTLRDGKRYGLGSLLPGGWRLDGIEDSRIRLSKDGQTEILDY
ncbi:SctD/MshK family protein [Alsobacter soli]|uniref:SctD/MshK family protein n=1 Tax=Alsobacter soli TaxID=2109933 RepID=UPI0011B215C7|nr:hypothetical protein [Alsobacter soli]